jgi:DNA segregation ATPase FtsK/SpoIIIE-like protein
LLGDALYQLLAFIMPPILRGVVCWILLTTGVLLLVGYQWVAHLRAFFAAQRGSLEQANLYRAAHEIECGPQDALADSAPDSALEELIVTTKPRHVTSDVEEPIPYPFPELAKQTADQQQYDKNALQATSKAQVLEEKLLRFGIRGTVTSITVGPLVTLYEYQPHI